MRELTVEDLKRDYILVRANDKICATFYDDHTIGESNWIFVCGAEIYLCCGHIPLRKYGRSFVFAPKDSEVINYQLTTLNSSETGLHYKDLGDIWQTELKSELIKDAKLRPIRIYRSRKPVVYDTREL